MMFKRLAFVLLIALALNVVLAEKSKEEKYAYYPNQQGNRGFGRRPNHGGFGQNQGQYPYGQQPIINPRTNVPMVLPNQQCFDSNSCPWGYECTGLCTRRNNVDDTGSCFDDHTCQAGYSCQHGTNCHLTYWDQVGRCRADGKCIGGYVCNFSNGFCYCV